MPVTQIDRVDRLPLDDVLLGAHLDKPRPGSHADVYRLDLVGWALGRHRPIVTLEVYAGRLHLITAPVSQERPDIGAAFPNVPWAKRAGFRTSVSLLGTPGPFAVRVDAITDDGRRVNLGLVHGRRAAVPEESQPAPLPLLVTTLGRSGSTWLLRLLGRHPDVLAYRPFQQDTRVAAYWIGVLDTLAKPTSYQLSVANFGLSGAQWWAGNGAVAAAAEMAPGLTDWLGRQHVESLLAFCRDRINSTYRQMAAQEDSDLPYYVAEKVAPNRVPHLAHDLFPHAPELLLVRDFRDLYCSIVAYNKRHGDRHFGRPAMSSEEDYIRKLGRDADHLASSWRDRKERAHVVRYEDLVRSPGDALRDILNYLGLSASSEIVDNMVGLVSSRAADEDRHRTVSNASESIGRWRRDLSTARRETCHEALAPALAAFGYE